VEGCLDLVGGLRRLRGAVMAAGIEGTGAGLPLTLPLNRAALMVVPPRHPRGGRNRASKDESPYDKVYMAGADGTYPRSVQSEMMLGSWGPDRRVHHQKGPPSVGRNHPTIMATIQTTMAVPSAFTNLML
jgi:hypothetical protein